jgi:beta-fructofuranosidase
VKNLIAYWSFDEGCGKVVQEVISAELYPIHYVFNDAKFKPSTEPLWRTGVIGNSLLFDGYSTFLEKRGGMIQEPLSEWTIEAWVAPRSFEYGEGNRPSAIINQHHREEKKGFLLGLYRHGSWTFQIGTGNGWYEIWDEKHPLPVGEWSHITAVFSGEQGKLTLFLNGALVSSKDIPVGTRMFPAPTDLLIGKNNHAYSIENVFSLNMFGGLIDEVKVYNRSLNAVEIKIMYSEVKDRNGGIPEIPYDEMRLDRTVYVGDRHRPMYHLIPPGHWMNEPHAPIYFKGKYHLFYQHNPKGPYWHYIHWGHWVSEDMVHWKDIPMALTPEKDEVDPDGCWSGSACYDENGVPALFFTAGNDSRFPNQMTGLARSTFLEDEDVNLTSWKKHPVPITIQKEGIGMKMGDFRDPFVWKEGDIWYQLVGTATEAQGGTAAIYVSSNLVDWEYKGLFYESQFEKYPFLGPIWELPVFLPIGQNSNGETKHVFIVSPVGPGADVEVWYWIGTWDKENFRFVPDDEEARLIDIGDFHFTGPSGFIDPQTGRAIIFTIAQGQRTLQDEYDAGWAHNGGLPLEIFLKNDGLLGIRPIKELQSLRDDLLIDLEKVSLEYANSYLSDIKEDMLEIQIVFESESEVGIAVKRSPNGEEETYLYCDPKRNVLGVNRERTTLDPQARTKGIQEGTFEPKEKNISFHLFLDKSMIELYVNEAKSLTSRAYPTREDSLGLQLRSDSQVIITKLKVWRMKSAYEQR